MLHLSSPQFRSEANYSVGLSTMRGGHSPTALPPISFGSPPSNWLTCAVGVLPWQIRLPAIAFVCTSLESLPGTTDVSIAVFFEKLTFPPTWLRMTPIHCPVQPWM